MLTCPWDEEFIITPSHVVSLCTGKMELHKHSHRISVESLIVDWEAQEKRGSYTPEKTGSSPGVFLLLKAVSF